MQLLTDGAPLLLHLVALYLGALQACTQLGCLSAVILTSIGWRLLT